MQFLVVSDLHLFNYPSYNESFDNDMPSRLSNYLKLASLLGQAADSMYGKMKDQAAIIISGDFYHAATLRPMVLNIGEEFIETLVKVSGLPVYIVPGQHEIDEKTSKMSDKNVLIRTLSKLDNVMYCHDCTVEFNDGTTAYMLGWEPTTRDVKSMADADMFIGHNMVATAKNFAGHQFTSGFDAKALSEKYELSIIGDIHMGQTLFGNVLIPGPPIQHNFTDPEACGFWTTSVYKGGMVPPTFHQVKEPCFPRFINVTEDSQIIPATNVFYKKKPSIAKRSSDPNAPVGVAATDLEELTKRVCGSLKIDCQDEVTTKALALLDSVQVPLTTTAQPSAKLKAIDIDSFCSIQKYAYEFPEDKVLILGPVGSGKSTILKALCWGLYGKVVGYKSADHFIPKTFASGGTIVTVFLELNDEVFQVVRTLKHATEGNSLRIWKLANQTSSEIKKSSMRETQKFIDELIGMNYDDFTTLCLYAQKRASFFGTMTDSYQTSLLMKFLGGLEDQLKALAAASKAKLDEATTNVHQVTGGTSALQASRFTHASRLGSLQAQTMPITQIKAQLAALTLVDADMGVDLIQSAKTREECLNELIGTFKLDAALGVVNRETLSAAYTTFNTAHRQCEDQVSGANLAIQKAQMTKTSAAGTIEGKSRQIEALQRNVCWTCNRTLDTPPDTKAIKAAEKEIKQAEEALENASREITDNDKIQSMMSQKSAEFSITVETLSRVSHVVSQFDEILIQSRSDLAGEVSSLRQTVASLDQQIQGEQAKLAAATSSAEQWKIVKDKVFSSKGIFAHALESVGSVLSDYMNQMLKNANSDIRVRIDTVTWNKSGTPSSKLDIIVKFGPGKELEYPQLSGGQSMLIDALSIVGFFNVLSEKHGLPDGLLGFIALDEIIQYVDDVYVDVVKSVLDELKARTALLISHNPQLAKVFGRCINVKLDNNKSVYEEVA